MVRSKSQFPKIRSTFAHSSLLKFIVQTKMLKLLHNWRGTCMVSVNQTKKSYDIMNITAWEANHFFFKLSLTLVSRFGRDHSFY